MRRRKFYLSQWQGKWNVVTQTSCDSKPTHAHFNYYDVCSHSTLIGLLVWVKDLNCKGHICFAFFTSRVRKPAERTRILWENHLFICLPQERLLPTQGGQFGQTPGQWLSGRGNSLGLYCLKKLWDSKPKHEVFLKRSGLVWETPMYPPRDPRDSSWGGNCNSCYAFMCFITCHFSFNFITGLSIPVEY